MPPPSVIAAAVSHTLRDRPDDALIRSARLSAVKEAHTARTIEMITKTGLYVVVRSCSYMPPLPLLAGGDFNDFASTRLWHAGMRAASEMSRAAARVIVATKIVPMPSMLTVGNCAASSAARRSCAPANGSNSIRKGAIRSARGSSSRGLLRAPRHPAIAVLTKNCRAHFPLPALPPPAPLQHWPRRSATSRGPPR